jgi:mannitol operon repressor
VSDHLADFHRVMHEIDTESPRGRVMVATAMLDDLLGKSIAARLVDSTEVGKLLDGFNAPLGSFSARIVAALGLGVISKREFDDLQIIRKIRNDFAHRTGISFADPAVRDRTMLLKLAAQDYGDVVVEAEGRFTSAAVSLILNFTNRPHYVGLKRLAHEPWPY